MNLDTAIANYGLANLTSTNDWYQWRKINPRYLPHGINLSAGNQFSQNVALKHSLNAQYVNGDEKAKIDVTKYYIAVWGGVKRNSADKIKHYSLGTPSDLVARGTNGVASWSKALCIRDPHAYAIYDARVAVAINCLQIISGVNSPRLFPLLIGQNKEINIGSKMICRYACHHDWTEINEDQFYQEYNNALLAASDVLGVEHCVLEMLLFSHAPILLNSAIPKT